MIDASPMLSEPSSYAVEIDGTSERDWNHILEHFDDANVWQTWSYGAVMFGEDNLSHLVLTKHGRIVSAAQLAILSLPILRTRIAYIKYGPLRRVRGEAPDADVDRTMLRAIIETYVEGKGCLLRLMPRVLEGGEEDLPDLLQDIRVRWKRQPAGGTFLIDLSPNAEEQLMGLRPKWRAALRKAQKRGLEVVELDPVAGVDTFMRLYNEMLARKQFVDQSDIELLPRLQAALPEPHKLKILACLEDGEVCAMNVFSVMGDIGISLFGVAGERGRGNGASYIVNWWILNWLKENGLKWYDLGGAGDPKVNEYKRGLAGKYGRAEQFVGKFDVSGNPATLLAFTLADRARQIGARIKERVKSVRCRGR